MNRSMLAALALGAFLGLPACGDPEAPTPGNNPAKPGDPGPDAGHHGVAVDLGSATIGSWRVRAARDSGSVTAGGEVPVDVWVTGDKVENVRFWVGVEDASGSMKVRALIEDPAEPDHYHTHAEVPDPLPDSSRLWVEIEAQGKRSVGSFDLQR